MELDETLVAFTARQAQELTGVTRRKLDYWIDRGLITPQVDEAKGRGRVRLFSLSDLVELRVAVWLRDRISLQLIRKVVDALRAEGLDHPLRSITFGVIEGGARAKGDDLVIQRDDGEWERAVPPGQLIMQITVPVERFRTEIGRGLEAERKRTRHIGKVERRRGVLGSVEVFAGTRIPVRSIKALHDAGYSVERILESYPGITERDVRAAI